MTKQYTGTLLAWIGLAITICVTTLGTTAQAAGSKDSLIIEVLAFTPPGSGSADAASANTVNDYWHDTAALPPCHAARLGNDGNAALAFEDETNCIRTPGALTKLTGIYGANNTALTTEAEKLKRNGYTLLLNRSWRQTSATLAPVLLRSERAITGQPELQGTLTLTETERYLELGLAFVLARTGEGMPQYVTLKESRKIKSGELQYFDHPLLGLIVLVTANTPASTPP